MWNPRIITFYHFAPAAISSNTNSFLEKVGDTTTALLEESSSLKKGLEELKEDCKVWWQNQPTHLM